MPQAQLTVDPHFAVGTVNRRLFGSFVEHLGRCVYDGIYEPPGIGTTSRSPTSETCRPRRGSWSIGTRCWTGSSSGTC